MKKVILRKKLLSELGKLFLPDGFVFSKKRSGIVKAELERSLSFHVIFLNRSVGWDVWCGWGIRIEQIEEFFHRTSGYEEHFGTCTIGYDHTDHINGPAIQWPVCNEDNLATTISDLNTVFREMALPFYHKYSTLIAIDRALNENPDEVSHFHGFEPIWCPHGLIVAKEVKRLNYHELVQLYRSKIERLSQGFYLARYDALVKELDQII